MTMYLHDELVRAQMSARMGEAHEVRLGRQAARARRSARRAERAAAQARLALARSV